MPGPDSRAACNGIAAAFPLRFSAELEIYAGRSIDVPSCFISGRQDWGTYQRPGVFEAMQTTACTQMVGCHLVDGAGHWVQQEQPGEVSRLLLQFLRQAKDRQGRGAPV
jgi:pimeloyl-ACP methyl ester carboxylesterase